MLEFKKYFVQAVKADATLSALIKNGTKYNVYPTGIDILPEAFPAITYMDAGDTILTVPRGAHIGLFQIDIWSIKDALQVEEIYTSLARVFNFKSSSTAGVPVNGILWWIRQESARDNNTTTDRRIWRKTVDMKYWFTNTNQT